MKRFGWMALAGMAASLTLGVVGSQASEVMFSFAEGDHFTETFLIDQRPAMYDPNGVGGEYAYSPSVTATVHDIPGGANQTIVTPDQFLMTPEGNFFGIYFDGLILGQWFTGTVDAPTFMPGAYVSKGPNELYGTEGFTMTITAVPEPATWLMMMVGLGGLGATLRQRRKIAAFAHA